MEQPSRSRRKDTAARQYVRRRLPRRSQINAQTTSSKTRSFDGSLYDRGTDLYHHGTHGKWSVAGLFEEGKDKCAVSGSR